MLRCFLIGSKELSVKILEELVNSNHLVLGVLSEDYKESMKIWNNQLGHRSLKEEATELNIPVYEKININTLEMQKKLTEMNLDIIFSVQGSQILKEEVLNIPKLGCFNLHTAYLPKNRGCFPIAWSIINNEKFSGFTIHKILLGINDGPIVSQIKIPIEKEETGKSLYEKVTDFGYKLFKETLPKFDDLSFQLIPQNPNESTYHPCTNVVLSGYPYGGQIDSYWDTDKKKRFNDALHFPPFKGASLEPPRYLGDKTDANVRVMLGFDCDRPRGSLIVSQLGIEMAERKINSIEIISKSLEKLMIPRTFFLCGQWLESMNHKFDDIRLRNALNVNSQLVEIGDHSYSHNIVKKIITRPDKIPITAEQVVSEYKKNSTIFEDILEIKKPKRGFRTPLGHFNGLTGEHILHDKLVKVGVSYVSSDLRGKGDTINPPLKYLNGIPRQPYRYENGLLEIPSMGWQDVVFSQRDYVSQFEEIPKEIPTTYKQIIEYYCEMILESKNIAIKHNRDYFLGLCLHPYDSSFYNNNGKFFEDIYSFVESISGSFCTYNDVNLHYNSTLQIQ